MTLADSRRNFLKTAGLLAGATVVAGRAFPAMAAAKSGEAGISLAECQAMSPIEMARSSVMVQNAWKSLQEEIASIRNPSLRASIADIYGDPTPRITQALDEKTRRQIWQELTAKNYTKQALADVLPAVPNDPGTVMPFDAAPGSGYQSHHAYPGGLVTHVATNVRITSAIVETYQNVYGYRVDRDIALAAQLLHDLHKPYVFQWNDENSSRTEQTLAGTGEHHVLSAAELITRKVPPELVIAMISAHQCATTDDDEKILADWLEAAAIVAGVDPVAHGLISTKHRLPEIPRQEGFICHLGDHDFVLSVPAVKTTLPVMRQIAAVDYKMSEADLNGKVFNKLRNRVYSTYSAMRIHEEMTRHGKEGVRRLMSRSVHPV
ncbi:MAG: HD domain-containing protein [Candidatus Accumulibacter sp.]|nr:HD domain-containing protein [Accumulibacter sp.]